MAERYVCLECNTIVESAARGSCGRPGHVPVALRQDFSVARWATFLAAVWTAVVACLVWLERAAYNDAGARGDVSEVRRLALVSAAHASLLLLIVTGQVRCAQWALRRRVRHAVGPAAELRPVLSEYMLQFKRASALAWTLIVLLLAVWLWQLDWFVHFLAALLSRL